MHGSRFDFTLKCFARSLMQMTISPVPDVTFRPRDVEGDAGLDDGGDFEGLLSFLPFVVVGVTATACFRAGAAPAVLFCCPPALLFILPEYAL